MGDRVDLTKTCGNDREFIDVFSQQVACCGLNIDCVSAV